MKKKQNEDPGVKVGLTALVVKDGKVLLGKRQHTETASGLWAYPGGRMNYGETPEVGIVREVLEETGMVINPSCFKFLRFENEFFPKEKKHYVSLVFLVWDAWNEPEVKESKCKEWRWFDPDNIPENTFWAAKKNIKMYKVVIKRVCQNK